MQPFLRLRPLVETFRDIFSWPRTVRGDRRAKRTHFGGEESVGKMAPRLSARDAEGFNPSRSERSLHTLDDYGRMRRAHRVGMSIRKIARQ